MSEMAASLLACGVDEECQLEMDDYGRGVARWCPGCGDHAILTAIQRLLTVEQLRREDTVFVSGIGCSSRFPHYISTYGFHGIHGRALPIATGIRLARPDLHVFVSMGDGDCCSIGAGHWIHSIRYNVNMVAMLFDNNIYGLTKNQSSPTSPLGLKSYTQPKGSFLPALNPLVATLGVTNASFVAQTADWAPSHLYETLHAAFKHKGFAFVRILQRCPVWTPKIFEQSVFDPNRVELLVHEEGVQDAGSAAIYKNTIEHDPSDIHGARELASTANPRLGLFYKDTEAPRYEETRELPAYTPEQKIAILDQEFNRHAV